MHSRTAVLHGRWDGFGGGPRVAAEIARTFDAPIFATHVGDEHVPRDVEVRELSRSPLDELAYRAVHRGPLPGTDLWDAQRFSHIPELAHYDTVIVTQGPAAWYVPTDGQTLVRYIHSPTGWTYDRWQTRDTHLIRRCYAAGVRALHTQRNSYPDRYVANSELVAQRTRRYLDRDAPVNVVYPPVASEGYPDTETEDWLVHVGRLDRCKRIGLCIRAAAQADRKLVIAGRGDDRDRLESIAAEAGADVDFRGYVSEDEKRALLTRAQAALFAGVQEDFGIAPVEAMMAGTPVVGVGEGFTQHQIRDWENGLTALPHPKGMAAAVKNLCDCGVEWSADEIATYARKNFGRERFQKHIALAVSLAEDEATVEADLTLPREVRADA